MVSAENIPYMAWQAKLFHFSCVTRLKRVPTIVVHESGQQWHPYFLDVVNAGGTVLAAPSYGMTEDGRAYPPRNTAGTLLRAADIPWGRDDFCVLCDPDMLFVRPPKFPQALSGDTYDYLDYLEAAVQKAASRMGVTLDMIAAQREELRCGAPYVIPAIDMHGLATAWLEAIDAFPPACYIASMYGFGIAALKLGMNVIRTRMVATNHEPNAPLTADVIHYCYGDDSWNKRQFMSQETVARVWDPCVTPTEGTVLEEILLQIHEAREFYRRVSER